MVEKVKAYDELKPRICRSFEYLMEYAELHAEEAFVRTKWMKMKKLS